jgi:hypothetical protein
MNDDKSEDPKDRDESRPHRLRLPGFLNDEELGLGDAITRATAKFGLRPCGGCQRRAAAFNRWLLFTRTRAK